MLGEIIETSTLDFVAESLTLHQPPPLGSLVKVQVQGATYCYGVVCFGTTSSADSGRRAVRRSQNGAVNEAVYQEHPQLERLLQTLFRVSLVGHVAGKTVRQMLPPSPPPLHFAVYPCGAGEAQQFSDAFGYFRLVLQAKCETPTEQVLAAHIRQLYEMRGQDMVWLKRAARESAQLLKQEHQRLLTLLSTIDPM
jgi:hypothetical protein